MKKKAVTRPNETSFYWGWKGQFEEARIYNANMKNLNENCLANSKGTFFSIKIISRTCDFCNIRELCCPGKGASGE